MGRSTGGVKLFDLHQVPVGVDNNNTKFRGGGPRKQPPSFQTLTTGPDGRNYGHRERESEQGLLSEAILIINNLGCLNRTDIKREFMRPLEWPLGTGQNRHLFGGVVGGDEDRQFALSE